MIYLDAAATTYPKPQSVARAMLSCLSEAGGNPGRSGHTLSMKAGEVVYACREAVSSLLHSAKPENVVFTPNDTYALNLALKALLRPGDHVLVSELEHNSVLRPIAAMGRIGVKYSVFPVIGKREEEILSDIRRLIRPDTRMVCCLHASNVCGAVLPVRQIGRLCREKHLRFVLDAAQSAGVLPLSFEETGADAICAPGHKGLYGPQGSGFVCFSPDYGEKEAGQLRTVTEGGTGILSRERSMPPFLPERLEAGTLMTPCLAGLAAGIKEVEALGIDAIRAHECALFRLLRDRIAERAGIRVYLPEAEGGILLFSVKDRGCAEIAEALDKRGICVRAGLHCAPLAHKALSTPEDGAVRVSFSIYNTQEETEEAADAILQIASQRESVL